MGLLLLPDSVRPIILKIAAALDPQRLIRRLGGTVKIGAELGQDFSDEKLLQTMAEELKTVEGKINFGISICGSTSAKVDMDLIETWGKKLKKLLKDEGRSVRYVFKKETALSSATVANNGLDARGREFLVYKNKNTFSLAKTTAVQPFEEFSQRDFGRPGRDDVSGMLPPKLAMMLINISGASPHEVLLDPFCGSGTILSEALLLGFDNLMGSDISERAVEDTKKNIAWIQGIRPDTSRGNISILQSGVADLHKQITSQIGAVVTEPFLGPPLKGYESRDEVIKNTKPLIELYLNAFREFKKILQPRGTIVFIIPRFQVKGQWINISGALLPELKKLGFTPEPLLPNNFQPEPYLLYHRANQRVGREIWKFKPQG